MVSHRGHDDDVAEPAALEHMSAQETLPRESDPLVQPHGRLVVGENVQVHADQSERPEGIVEQEPAGLGGEPLAAGARLAEQDAVLRAPVCPVDG
jgi:hypothetical protein